MPVDVPRIFPTFDSSAAKIRAVGSSIRFAQPMAGAINHLLGATKMGLLCWQTSEQEPAANTSMERSFYTYRHPNTTHLHCLIYTGSATSDSAKIEVTAGGGDTVSTEIGFHLVEERWLELVAPWDSADSGYQEIVITGTGVGFRCVVIHEVYNRRLDPASDTCLSTYETTYTDGGLRHDRYIMDSTVAGPEGMIARSKDAWSYGLRQGVSWWSTAGTRSVNSTSWTNPLNGQTFSFKARQRQSESTRDHRVYAYTWCAATVSGYQWRMSSSGGGDTVTSGSLSHSSAAWTGSPLTGLAIDCTAADDLTFEMRRTAGTGLIYVQRISAPEEVV